MRKKSLIILVIAVLIANCSLCYGQVATPYKFSDISGHWAENVLSKWVTNGYLKGFPDGSIKPNSGISKVEFIALINRVYGFHEESSSNYSDVYKNDWYKKDTSIAKRNGYMAWYTNRKLYPSNKITRQDVCSIIYHTLDLDGHENSRLLNSYHDSDYIPSWSKEYISAVIASGYMTGYPDKTLKVKNGISRAEAISLLDRIVGELITKSGTYGSKSKTYTICKNLTINKSGVTIRNKIIKGDLILAAGIKDGSVNLDNVTVNGRTIVNGGGKNSIIIRDSDINEIIVDKINDNVLILSKNSDINKIVQKSGGRLEGDFDDCTVDLMVDNEDIVLDGDFYKLTVRTKSDIDIKGSSKIKKILIKDDASGTKIDTDRSTRLGHITFDAPTRITGRCYIDRTSINSRNVYIEKKSHNDDDDDFDDTTSPNGYYLYINQSKMNISNEHSMSFYIHKAEIGAKYKYYINDSSNYTSTVQGYGYISYKSQLVSNINISSLVDGNLSLSVYLIDSDNNQGYSVTNTIIKDTVKPSNYTLAMKQSQINNSNQTNLSFFLNNGELYGNYYYSIDDTNSKTPPIKGNGLITSITQDVKNINVSSLQDGTLTMQLYTTDNAGNIGNNIWCTIVKETSSPSDYSVQIHQSIIDSTNVYNLSFNFIDSEIGSKYQYTISSSSGGTPVDGAGTITCGNDTISNINVQGLNDGILTLRATLMDNNNNTGLPTTDTVDKAVNEYTDHYVEITEKYVSDSMTFTIQGSNVAPNYTYHIDDNNGGTSAIIGNDTMSSTTHTLSDTNISTLDDGTITLTISLIDSKGIIRSIFTDTATKDSTKPLECNLTIKQDNINSSNATKLAFTMIDSELDTDYYYTIYTDINQSNTVGGNGTITGSSQTIHDIDVSRLLDGDLTLDLYLKDKAGNTSDIISKSIAKDSTPPTDYSVDIDPDSIDTDNEYNLSFTFINAEIGATYHYTIKDDYNSDYISGTSTISTTSETLNSIDVSSLKDGLLTLEFYLIDNANNKGKVVTDTVQKNSDVPSGYSIQTTSKYNNTNSLSFDLLDAENGAVYTYSIDDTNNATQPVIGSSVVDSSKEHIDNVDISTLDDGTLTISLLITDVTGSVGDIVTKTIIKDTKSPTIVQLRPDNSSSNVAIDSSITITFNEKVNLTDFNMHFATGDIVFTNSNCSISISNDTIIITPNIELLNNHIYSNVTISGAVDLAGNTLNYNDSNYRFTTVEQVHKTEINVIYSSKTGDNQIGGIYTFNGIIDDKPSYKKYNGDDAMVLWSNSNNRWEMYINYHGIDSGNGLGSTKELIGTHHSDEFFPPIGAWTVSDLSLTDSISISY